MTRQNDAVDFKITQITDWIYEEQGNIQDGPGASKWVLRTINVVSLIYGRHFQ